MNPFFNFGSRQGDSRLNELFAGLVGTSPEAGAAPATTAVNAAAGPAMGETVKAVLTPGSLRRGLENTGAVDALNRGLDAAAYYAGPHLTNRAAAVPAAGQFVDNMFGNKDALAASAAYQRGDYGTALRNEGLATATALLDVPTLGMGSRIAGPVLKAVNKAAHWQPSRETDTTAMLASGPQPATGGNHSINFWDALLRR